MWLPASRPVQLRVFWLLFVGLVVGFSFQLGCFSCFLLVWRGLGVSIQPTRSLEVRRLARFPRFLVALRWFGGWGFPFNH